MEEAKRGELTQQLMEIQNRMSAEETEDDLDDAIERARLYLESAANEVKDKGWEAWKELSIRFAEFEESIREKSTDAWDRLERLMDLLQSKIDQKEEQSLL
ncbi:MAG TPA: hypothetical protein VEA18_02525 [Candidatus Kapabacteria bacterium]|nr:hypothetical protein [Candidatus Kapabacteria bacterium]